VCGCGRPLVAVQLDQQLYVRREPRHGLVEQRPHVGEPVRTAEEGPGGLVFACLAGELVARRHRDVRRNRDQPSPAAQRKRERGEHISAVQRDVSEIGGGVP
jgi:hypothetical protein